MSPARGTRSPDERPGRGGRPVPRLLLLGGAVAAALAGIAFNHVTWVGGDYRYVVLMAVAWLAVAVAILGVAARRGPTWWRVLLAALAALCVLEAAGALGRLGR